MDKQTARKNCLELRKLIKNKSTRDQDFSTKINKIIKTYKTIWVYKPIHNEIELNLQTKSTLLYPIVIKDEIHFYEAKYWFTKSKLWILEPKISPLLGGIEGGLIREITPDILIIPCVWFYKNYRLWYGGGYYDKYLAKHKVQTIWIAYTETKLDSLEIEEFDIQLWKIVVG